MAQENTTTPSAKKLLTQVREEIRFKHSRISTEKNHISRIKHQIVFNGKHHTTGRGAVEMERFWLIWPMSFMRPTLSEPGAIGHPVSVLRYAGAGFTLTGWF